MPLVWLLKCELLAKTLNIMIQEMKLEKQNVIHAFNLVRYETVVKHAD